MSKGIKYFLTLLTTLLWVNGAYAQAYNQMTWGIQNTSPSPYAFGVNVSGNWYNLGTLSSTGAYTLNVSGITTTSFSTSSFATTSITTSGLIVSPLTGYVYCNGAAPCTASIVIPPSGGGIGPVIGTNMNTSIASYGATATNANVVGAVNLTANLTVPSNVTLNFQKGGCITQTGSYTLTINGSINASEGQQLFCGFSAGQVTFASGGLTTTTFPEWWGAVPNGTTESGVAIQSATSALPSGGSVQFNTGNYVSSTCNYNIQVSSLAWIAPPTRGSTLLTCSSDSATILTVGNGTFLGLNRNAIEGGFIFYRSAATPAIGSKGVYINGTANMLINGASSNNSQFNFYFKNFGNSYCTKCTSEYGLSTSPGSDPAQNIILFWLDVSAPAYSSFLTDTFALVDQAPGAAGRTASNVYGYYIGSSTGFGSTNDIFLTQAASSQVDYGVLYDGYYGNAFDVFLINNIHDFFGKVGIKIQNIANPPGGAFTIQGGWINPYATGSATTGIEIDGSVGVNVTGGTQLFAGGNYANHTALACNLSGSVNINGNRFMNAKNPIVFNGCYTSAIVGNNFFNISGQSANAQIALGTASNTSFRNTVNGNIFDGYATTAIDATYGTYSSFAGNNCNPGNITNCEINTIAANNQSVDSILPENPSYTPTISFTGGTSPAATNVVAKYSRVGNIATVRLSFNVTYGASAPTAMTISLPPGYTGASSIQIIPGRNSTQGTFLQGVIAGSGTVISPFTVSNAWPVVASGDQLIFEG